MKYVTLKRWCPTARLNHQTPKISAVKTDKESTYTCSDTRMRASGRGTRLYMNNQDESPAALGVSHCPAAMVLRCADFNTNRDGHLKHRLRHM